MWDEDSAIAGQNVRFEKPEKIGLSVEMYADGVSDFSSNMWLREGAGCMDERYVDWGNVECSDDNNEGYVSEDEDDEIGFVL